MTDHVLFIEACLYNRKKDKLWHFFSQIWLFVLFLSDCLFQLFSYSFWEKIGAVKYNLTITFLILYSLFSPHSSDK